MNLLLFNDFRSTTQGLLHGLVNEDRKLTENIECNGNEIGLEKCNIVYTSRSRKDCQLAQQIVSITCVHDSFASCPQGEVPYKGSCYTVSFNRSSFHDAQTECLKVISKFNTIFTQNSKNFCKFRERLQFFRFILLERSFEKSYHFNLFLLYIS